MFKSFDLHKKCCLTCHYFRVRRSVEVIGTQTCINYDNTNGQCGIYNNFPQIVNTPANMTSYCRYKRWVELPD